MKLKLKDKVMIISGRDKGKTGEIIAVLPARDMVLVEGLNQVKKHRKPTQADHRGGIVELTKPISISKVQVIDPKTGKPARIGWNITTTGAKERIFKVASYSNKKAAKKTVESPKATEAPAKKEAKS